LHALTYRVKGHVSVDPAAYRDPYELAAALQTDPIARLRERFMALALSGKAPEATNIKATSALTDNKDMQPSDAASNIASFSPLAQAQSALAAIEHEAQQEVAAALQAADAAAWPESAAAYTDIQTTGAGTWF